MALLRSCSSSERSTCSATEDGARTWPVPWQCGQSVVVDSSTPVRMRCRDISSRPKCEMRPTWMRARSFFSALLHPALDGAVVALLLHVDEVDDDQPGEVAEPELPGDFLGGLEVGLERGVLDVVLAGRAAGIDVDRDQRLGLVDDQVAARAQRHLRREHRVELRLDAGAGEQRLRLAIGLHVLGMARHEHAHEVLGLAIGVLAGDDDLVDVLVVEVADRALDQAAFLVDQRRRARPERELADVLPQPQQVLEVALDLGLGAAGAGGAQDDPHPLRHVEIGDDLLHLLAVGGRGDLARDAAAAGGVGHQHRIAAGEREVGGQRRALVAALLLHDLDEQHLAALDHLLDLVLARALAVAPLRHLLEGILGADRTRPGRRSSPRRRRCGARSASLSPSSGIRRPGIRPIGWPASGSASSDPASASSKALRRLGAPWRPPRRAR